MNNNKMKIKIIAFVFLLSISQTPLKAVNGIFTGSRAVTVTQGYDFSGNTIIIASAANILIGVLADPLDWNVTTISTGVSLINNSGPVILANPAGDIIVAWTYLDTSFVPQVAASILLRGSSSWVSTSITSGSSAGSNAYNDMELSGDGNGNVILSWTAYDSLTATNQVYGATVKLSLSTTWSDPFLIFN